MSPWFHFGEAVGESGLSFMDDGFSGNVELCVTGIAVEKTMLMDDAGSK